MRRRCRPFAAVETFQFFPRGVLLLQVLWKRDMDADVFGFLGCLWL